jgi:glycerate-2-kinase
VRAQHTGDRVEVIAPMASFGEAVTSALVARGLPARRLAAPLSEDVAAVAERLVHEEGLVVGWGEPTVRLPTGHGRGGRAQQLALDLALRLCGTARAAFVAGSDGRDGPDPDAAAGAYVDGTTWDAVVAAGGDPANALARCDAAPALDLVHARFGPGPTGINHADVVIVG